MKIIEFHDGSNNNFIIKKEQNITIEYNPVKPEFSSSGIYDGGDYINKEITLSQFNEVLALFNEIILRKDEHVKSRMKGTGVVVIDGEDKCILGMNSKSMNEIEEKLKSFL